MNNTFKVIDITNCTYEFFYYMINIENLDSNKITMKNHTKLFLSIIMDM